MRIDRSIILWVLLAPLTVLAVLMRTAQPYLAVNAPVQQGVLAVEGWIEEPELRVGLPLVRDSAYSHVYTTGTYRPFSYYLNDREAIRSRPDSGKHWGRSLVVHVGGTSGAGFSVFADGDTLLHTLVEAEGKAFKAEVPPGTDTLTIISWNNRPNDGKHANIFIKYMEVDGTDLHRIGSTPWFVDRKGNTAPAWPTYAHRAREMLIAMGIPPERITAVPAWDTTGGRTRANANALGHVLGRAAVTHADVLTVGVHARRTWKLYRQACPEINIGVIALPDPFCNNTDWWKTHRGRATLLKELIGVSLTTPPEP